MIKRPHPIQTALMCLLLTLPCARAGFLDTALPSSAPETTTPVEVDPSSQAWLQKEFAEVNQQRLDVQDRIGSLQEQSSKLEANQPANDVLLRRIDLLERIHSSLAQHLLVLQETSDIQEDLQQAPVIAESRDRKSVLVEAVSLVKYDALIDQLDLTQDRLRQTEDRYQLALAEEDRARKTLREKESAYRLQNDQVETSAGKPGHGAAIQQLSIAALEREQATSMTRLREAELRLEKTRRLMLEKQTEELKTSIGLMKEHVVFSEDDLAERLRFIDELVVTLKAELTAAEKGLIHAEAHLEDAQQALKGPEQTAVQQARITAARMERRYRQRQIAVMNMRLYRNVQSKLLWERRFRILEGSVSSSDKATWIDEARRMQEQMMREGRLQQAKLAELREELRNGDELIEKAGSGSEEARWHEQRSHWISQQQILAQDNLSGIQRTQRLAHKLALEGVGTTTAEKFKNLGAQLRQGLHATWNFELTAVDDRPITTKKIILALLLFFVGLRLSRWFSHRMVKVLLRRTRTDPSGKAAVQSILFYLLVVVISVTALYLANIPLGLFALFGGALAIGVGFGSQTIINNFISGLILMMERPIRVGDMVEVEGNYGQIVRIGARCTQILTGTNIDLMVPNSTFLENNVINWTLSDDRFRCMVAVGAAYGSSTRQVEQLLLKAAATTQGVNASPAPNVIFRDFGDNSLLFEVHFWIRMKSQMERSKVESDVRYSIDQLFQDAGVVIAFPQRDVHLNTESPLEVRLVTPASDDSDQPK